MHDLYYRKTYNTPLSGHFILILQLRLPRVYLLSYIVVGQSTLCWYGAARMACLWSRPSSLRHIIVMIMGTYSG